MAFFWRRTAAVTAELHARRCLTSSFQLRLLATTAADPLPSAASTSTSAPPPPRRLGSETLGKLAAANEQAQAETAPATGELEQSPFSPLPKGTPSLRRAPKARGREPINFLRQLRRPSLVEAAPKFSSWIDLFETTSKRLEALGMQPKERKYLLYCLQRFRKNEHPKDFAFPVKSKRKIRGWGPKWQNGVRKPPRRNSN